MQLARQTLRSSIGCQQRAILLPLAGATARSTRQKTLRLCAAASSPASASKADWTVKTAGRRKEYQRDDLHVVLVHPQIPHNTGSVARTCAATSVALHLVKPLGFAIDDAKLKRAGLDYWPYVVVNVHDSWAAFHDFFREQGRGRLIAFSKFGRQPHTSPATIYRPGDWLMFGAETTGLPDEAHDAAAHVVRIPMVETHVRSLNLAVSVGVGVFEAVRQLDDHQRI